MSNENHEIVPQSVLPTAIEASRGLNAINEESVSPIDSNESSLEGHHQPPIALQSLSSEFRDEPYSDRQHKVTKPKKELASVKYLAMLKMVLSLENEGSTARDHLANERTVLAWIRTSLNFASVGVGIVQLFNLVVLKNDTKLSHKLQMAKDYRKPLGAGFLAIAILTVVFAFYRYFIIQKRLRSHQFPIARLTIIVIVLSTFALSITALAAIIRFQF